MSGASTAFVEMQVVGAVLANPHLYPRASFIESDSFSDASLRVIWKLIHASAASGRNISPAILALNHPSEIEPIGGASFLSRLAQQGEAIIPAFNDALDRLHDEQQWCRIARLSSRLQAAIEAREKPPSQVLSGLAEIAARYLAGGPDATRSKREVARAAIDEARRRRKIVTTGITNLDFLMQGGLQSKRLYGIGGLYGRGKTVLLGSISENLNLQSECHLFLSMETPPEDIEIRNCARHLNLNAASIHDQGDADHKVFLDAADAYAEAVPDNVKYDYVPLATMDEIHRKILASKSRHGIRGFILDYWQLIHGRERGQSLDDHLRSCADRLAAVCRQEDLWGVVTAQVDERGALKYSDALYRSASLYVRLVRDEDDSKAFFVTEKSNYTRYADTGNESVCGMLFDQQVGPHFRDTDDTDIAEMNREGNITI